jgi:hypothetical protein
MTLRVTIAAAAAGLGAAGCSPSFTASEMTSLSTAGFDTTEIAIPTTAGLNEVRSGSNVGRSPLVLFGLFSVLAVNSEREDGVSEVAGAADGDDISPAAVEGSDEDIAETTGTGEEPIEMGGLRQDGEPEVELPVMDEEEDATTSGRGQDSILDFDLTFDTGAASGTSPGF